MNEKYITFRKGDVSPDFLGMGSKAIAHMESIS